MPTSIAELRLWHVLSYKVETPPEPDVWLSEHEAGLFCARDLADLKRVPLRTRREKNGHRTKTFFEAGELRQVFRVQNSRMKLALLEASPWVLRRERATTGDPEMSRFISAAIALRTSEPNNY